MGRLIDADELKKKIEDGKIVIDEDVLNYNSIHDQLVYLLDKIEKFLEETIDGMPTAYNVEKVVEELDDVLFDYTYGFDYNVAHPKMEQIVRNGGKE